jgi:hypothetical protein
MKTSPMKARPTTATVKAVSASPNKSMRASVSSPTKTGSNDIEALQNENQNLQFALGDRDIEIERMKTTLFALNEKINVLSDIRNDVESHKAYIN